MVAIGVALCFLAGYLGARLMDKEAPTSVSVLVSFCVVVVCITALGVAAALAD